MLPGVVEGMEVFEEEGDGREGDVGQNEVDGPLAELVEFGVVLAAKVLID